MIWNGIFTFGGMFVVKISFYEPSRNQIPPASSEMRYFWVLPFMGRLEYMLEVCN